jgi:hypothetical protein
MPTRRLYPDYGKNPYKPQTPVCYHWDHNPPNMQVFEAGAYEHLCSGCGKLTHFTVSISTLKTIP